jgi:hypothetical protein
MIVMPTTSQSKSAARTTEVVEFRSRPLGETAEDVSRIAENIRAGQAFLKVVAYPWGVEFEVCGQEGER